MILIPRKLLLLIPILIIAGCGGGSSAINNPTIVLVTPVSSVIAAGATLQLQATVSGSSNTTVLWYVNNIPGGNSTVGTITAQGLYTAPNLPTVNGTVLINAAPQAFPSVSSSIIIGITFANVSLSGNYVFTLNGIQSGSPWITVGSFTANADGTISNGIEDSNGPAGISTALPFSGIYFINANGQGAATFTSAQASVTLGFTLNAQGQAVIMSTDSSDTATGTFYPQLYTALTLTSLNSTYVFNFTGADASGVTLSTTGVFVADGSETLSYGEEDLNNGIKTVNQAISGNYSIGANGHGTATFTDSTGTRTYNFYIVSPIQLQFIEIDNLGYLSGTVFQQQSVAATTTLAGGYVLYASGNSGNSAYATVGGFSTDPTNIGNIDGGTNDINDLGVLATNATLTGSFTTGAYGRGTISLTGVNGPTNYVYYFISPSAAFVLTSDPFINASGELFTQTGGYTTALLFGYFTLSQSTPVNTTPPSSAVGVIQMNGDGALAGFVNINVNGTVSGQQAFTGTYAVTTGGGTTATRGLATLITGGGTSLNYVFYPVSSNTVIMLSNGIPALTILVSQY